MNERRNFIKTIAAITASAAVPAIASHSPSESEAILLPRRIPRGLSVYGLRSVNKIIAELDGWSNLEESEESPTGYIGDPGHDSWNYQDYMNPWAQPGDSKWMPCYFTGYGIIAVIKKQTPEMQDKIERYARVFHGHCFEGEKKETEPHYWTIRPETYSVAFIYANGRETPSFDLPH